MIKDFFGNELQIGDIVIRPKFSSFCIHRIDAITKKRIKLSVKRLMYSYKNPLTLKNINYLCISDSLTVEDIKNHNGWIYISKENSNTNLIKWENTRKIK